ncbi:MAG: 30S ribosomal protein S8 [Anaerolineae bacterium]
MALHDPISDLLTRIRNGKMAKHRFVDLNVSRMKLSIIKILQEQGFIDNVLVNEEKKKVRVYLKYVQGRQAVLQGLKRVSCPGLRRYIGYKQIPKILGGMGIAILSTPKGIVDGETARNLKVGGELLCFIW